MSRLVREGMWNGKERDVKWQGKGCEMARKEIRNGKEKKYAK